MRDFIESIKSGANFSPVWNRSTNAGASAEPIICATGGNDYESSGNFEILYRKSINLAIMQILYSPYTKIMLY